MRQALFNPLKFSSLEERRLSQLTEKVSKKPRVYALCRVRHAFSIRGRLQL